MDRVATTAQNFNLVRQALRYPSANTSARYRSAMNVITQANETSGRLVEYCFAIDAGVCALECPSSRQCSNELFKAALNYAHAARCYTPHSCSVAAALRNLMERYVPYCDMIMVGKFHIFFAFRDDSFAVLLDANSKTEDNDGE